MGDGNGLAEAMLGLDGFRVLEVTEDTNELVVTVETTTVIEGCRQCGTRTVAHERRPVDVREGSPSQLRSSERRGDCAGRIRERERFFHSAKWLPGLRRWDTLPRQVILMELNP